MIQSSNLRFAYGSEFRLCIDQFEVGEGEAVALVGPSGCGKTTLLMLLAGVLVPDTGSLLVAQQSLGDMPEKSRRLFRAQRLGLIFQDFELIEYLTVVDNILLPFQLGLGAASTARMSRQEIQVELESLLTHTGLLDKQHQRPGQLSHGQRQRVAVCRALITRPRLILADEPTGSLDPDNAATILELLLRTVKQSGATLVMVTHDNSSLSRFDRCIRLTDLITQAWGSSSLARQVTDRQVTDRSPT